MTVVLDDDTIAGIEVQLDPNQTVEDWVEDAVARRYGDGETVDDPLLERRAVGNSLDGE